MNTEQLRSHYQPTHVRILMVGESPPVNGTFFYAGDSNLYRYTKTTFEQAYQQSWSTHQQFLEFFREQGFFLDDLCLEPVNGLTGPERRKRRRAHIDPLASRIRVHQPEIVLITPKGILPQVKKALQQAAIDAKIETLPFPAMRWQQTYVDTLDALLRRHCI